MGHPRRLQDPLELELQVAVSQSTWVLRTELRYSKKEQVLSTSELSLQLQGPLLKGVAMIQTAQSIAFCFLFFPPYVSTLAFQRVVDVF